MISELFACFLHVTDVIISYWSMSYWDSRLTITGGTSATTLCSSDESSVGSSSRSTTAVTPASLLPVSERNTAPWSDVSMEIWTCSFHINVNDPKAHVYTFKFTHCSYSLWKQRFILKGLCMRLTNRNWQLNKQEGGNKVLKVNRERDNGASASVNTACCVYLCPIMWS